MEDLQKRHRHEHKDLQSRITQKKKAASKKTRKGVNDECADLERQLLERQDAELAALDDYDNHDLLKSESSEVNESEPKSPEKTEEVTDSLKSLSVSASTVAPNGQAKKPNRQKARLARRAAQQEAAVEQAQKDAVDLPNLRDQERQSLQEAFITRGLKEHEIRSDGHCLYAAIADQLQNSDIGLKPKIELEMTDLQLDDTPVSPDYKVTRQVAAAYISQNPDNFAPFLEQPLDTYVKTIQETGEWGGHLEILALAKAYEVDVNVLQGDGSIQKIECVVQHDHPELWLAYYRHSFGLGEHYNSLRKVD